LVLIHHHITARYYFPAESKVGALLGGISTFGWAGVDIFLTLSSFLIVTLLMLERKVTGTISIRGFYIRRALRIWPLYLGFVVFGIVLLPLVLPAAQPYWDNVRWHLFLYLTFTGNFSYAYFPALNYAAHLWTISLEEQFYLVVPVLVVLAPLLGRSLGWWALGLMVIAAAFRLYIQANGVKYPIIWVMPVTRLDPFVVGAVCAWIYSSQRHLLSEKVGWPLAVCGVAGFALVAQGDYIGGRSLDAVWQFTLVAISSGALLLSALSKAGIGRMLSWPPVVFLGKISFGLYVYHLLPIMLEQRFLGLGDRLGKTPATWLLILAIVFSATVLLAVASYYGFERRFVRLKERYERIKSRPA
jgi:peptidoglycan/LPS O-acetylase OafA/YrhL